MMVLDCHWLDDFNRAIKHDAWGQVIEAIDLYTSLVDRLTIIMVAPQINLASGQKDVCGIMVTKLNLRIKGLRTLDQSSEAISLDELRELIPDAERLREEMNANHVETRKDQNSSANIQVLEDDDVIESQTSLPVQILEKGKTYVSITVTKIGLKDAAKYRNPFITITIKDKNGIYNLAPSRDSPIALTIGDNHVLFDYLFDLSKPLEDFPQDFVVFFEFKHYKIKQNEQPVVSTKCFSYIERSEITKTGSLIIELYKKPTDYRRKNLNLLTSKPLYLHLEITITKP